MHLFHRIQVLDEDRVKRNDFIGQTTIPLKRILVTNNKKMQKILEPKSEVRECSLFIPGVGTEEKWVG